MKLQEYITRLQALAAAGYADHPVVLGTEGSPFYAEVTLLDFPIVSQVVYAPCDGRLLDARTAEAVLLNR